MNNSDDKLVRTGAVFAVVVGSLWLISSVDGSMLTDGKPLSHLIDMLIFTGVGATLGIGVVVLLRWVPIIQNLVMPAFDEFVLAIAKWRTRLEDEEHKFDMVDAVALAAAGLSGAIVLSAVLVFIAHVATPIG